jgi:hypothetical protein
MQLALALRAIDVSNAAVDRTALSERSLAPLPDSLVGDTLDDELPHIHGRTWHPSGGLANEACRRAPILRFEQLTFAARWRRHPRNFPWGRA